MWNNSVPYVETWRHNRRCRSVYHTAASHLPDRRELLTARRVGWIGLNLRRLSHFRYGGDEINHSANTARWWRRCLSIIDIVVRTSRSPSSRTQHLHGGVQPPPLFPPPTISCTMQPMPAIAECRSLAKNQQRQNPASPCGRNSANLSNCWIGSNRDLIHGAYCNCRP